MNSLRLITFDVTETLLKFSVAPGVMYAKVGADFGVCVDHNKLTKHFKKHWNYMTNNHPNFGLKTIGWEKWWKEIVITSFEGSLEERVDVTVLNKIGANLIEIYKTPEGWETVEGAHELLSYLKSCNIPLGIISNFDVRLETIIKAMHLHHYFKFVITSYDSGFEKPDSKIFNLALSKLGTESYNALHIGNTPETDYIGAINAGWKAMLVNQNVKNILKDYPVIKPEDVFESLAELQSFLMKNETNL